MLERRIFMRLVTEIQNKCIKTFMAGSGIGYSQKRLQRHEIDMPQFNREFEHDWAWYRRERFQFKELCEIAGLTTYDLNCIKAFYRHFLRPWNCYGEMKMCKAIERLIEKSALNHCDEVDVLPLP